MCKVAKVATFAAAAIVGFGACGSDSTSSGTNRLSLTGFPYGIATAGEPEGSFRGAMSSYHMSDQDIDCMVRQAFASPPNRDDGGYEWTTEDLNTYAAECNVDFSDLWYARD